MTSRPGKISAKIGSARRNAGGQDGSACDAVEIRPLPAKFMKSGQGTYLFGGASPAAQFCGSGFQGPEFSLAGSLTDPGRPDWG